MNLISDEKTSTLTQGTDYSVTDRTITLTNPTSLKIQIYRETTTKPLIGWADASVLRAADMTVQSTQLLHISEETMDKVQDGGLAQDTTDGVWDARYNRIKNLLDPSESGDAVTLNYITKNQSSLLNQLTSTGAAQNASIVSTGDAQNTRLTSTGDTQNSRVTSTGDSYVSKITTTGTEQNDKVTATGDTYVASIQSNGDTQNTRVTNTATSYITTMTSLKDATNTKATEASNNAALSKAWAESSSSPDGNSSSKSSKSWASVAEGYKNSASTYASNAASSATNASTYMSKASTYASNASSSASSASTYASNASTAASNAKTSEGNAKTYATNAATSATEAASSATAAAESATKAATFDPDTYMPKADAHQLQRNTKYAVGDIAYSPSLPSYLYLECTTAGTTGATEPDLSTITGDVMVSDGTVMFTTKTVCAKEYVDSKHEDLLSRIAYRAGDTLSMVSAWYSIPGNVTGAGKNIIFVLPVSKVILAKKMRITKLDLVIRQNNNYFYGSPSSYANLLPYLSLYTPSTTTSMFDCGIYVNLMLTTAPSNIVNNSPLSIVVANITVEFYD